MNENRIHRDMMRAIAIIEQKWEGREPPIEFKEDIEFDFEKEQKYNQKEGASTPSKEQK